MILPSVEQVEKIFKKVRFILWKSLELVLLMIAMIGLAGQALRDVPEFRVWLDQKPLKAPAPPSVPPDYMTPRPEAPGSQQLDERKAEPDKIVRVAAQRRQMVLPVINRDSVDPIIDIDPPAPLDLARTEYANPIIPFEPVVPKPRHNAVIRAITAPARGIVAFARKVWTPFRDDKNSDAGRMAGDQQ